MRGLFKIISTMVGFIGLLTITLGASIGLFYFSMITTGIHTYFTKWPTDVMAVNNIFWICVFLSVNVLLPIFILLSGLYWYLVEVNHYITTSQFKLLKVMTNLRSEFLKSKEE